MDFQRILRELNKIISKYIEENQTMSKGELVKLSYQMTDMLGELIIEGVALRSMGHTIYNAKEFKIIKDTVSGLQSPTISWLQKVNKSLPDLIITLKVIKELDNKSYNSILWILNPR